MGLLVEGIWQNKWYDTSKHSGEFVRESAQLRNWITTDGTPGPSGESGFKAESGRYHLYVSLACPWAHRTLIFRTLKSLDNHITVSIVSPNMLDYGWTFRQDEGSTGDDLYQSHFLYEIYCKNQKNYTGRVTVPVLWDKQQNCIVSNESAEIIRMFNSAFNALTGNNDDYYPVPLQQAIDRINAPIYENINNGVYRCGFATEQSAYDNAYQRLFAELDNIEAILSDGPYLLGESLTEADWRLFTTLIRFDAVYFGHFKCNKRPISAYPKLSAYLRKLYHWPGVEATVNFQHIKQHYYFSHHMINPTQVVPVGPDLDYLNN